MVCLLQGVLHLRYVLQGFPAALHSGPFVLKDEVNMILSYRVPSEVIMSGRRCLHCWKC